MERDKQVIKYVAECTQVLLQRLLFRYWCEAGWTLLLTVSSAVLQSSKLKLQNVISMAEAVQAYCLPKATQETLCVASFCLYAT